jgi:hypothetical protein
MDSCDVSAKKHLRLARFIQDARALRRVISVPGLGPAAVPMPLPSSSGSILHEFPPTKVSTLEDWLNPIH